MYTFLDCYACVVRQATEALKQSGLKPEIQAKLLKEILFELSSTKDHKYVSSDLLRKAFRIIRETGNIHDPLENVKSYCMDVALRAYPELKHTLETSKNRFATAVRIAMSGNIIDHGHEEMRDNLALFKNIEDALTRPLVINHIDELQKEIEKAEKILYIADNAGETVFDRILIEELPIEKITYVVKGIPISNDTTLRDAKIAGLVNLVKVIEDGSDYTSVNLDDCSPEFTEAFNTSDLIIAKGQGNLKNMENLDKNIFFIARIRCKVTAHYLKFDVGDFLVKGLKVEE